MNLKKIAIWMIVITGICSALVFNVLQEKEESQIDVVEVNDIAQSLVEEWGEVKQEELPGLDYGFDYVILDQNYRFIAATREGLNTDLNSAIKNRDTIVDIKQGSSQLGKLILNNNTREKWNQYRKYLLAVTELFILLTATISLILALHIDRTIFQPFRKLKGFARNVAQGNLDIPLTMDKNNLFGAFSESFDLMREELKLARENERLANQSKKELVASLSHDIKTPVASIMAVAEVMHAKSQDASDQKQLKVITSKAEQINTLITNMFTATLEELQELKVSATEQSSQVIGSLIKNADYDNRVTYLGKAECIVLMDELRLAQVIDNIISNSYKYAGTSISASIVIDGDYLVITFKDFGQGVSEEEKTLIFNKFYRAKNSEGKSGAGLGLYISKYLMNKMSGDIEGENMEDGFIIRIKLLIA